MQGVSEFMAKIKNSYEEKINFNRTFEENGHFLKL
jgi:hypothetical protein